jgi:all-trans-retinol 13,14-reductase
MRAFVLAKIGLLPFVLFWSLAPAAPGPAIFASLAIAALLNFWRWRRGDAKQIEIAGLILFVLLGAGWLAAPDFVAACALPASFFAVALAAFVSLGRNKPWTADYSATAYPGQEESPIFIGVNKALSSLWMAIFLGLGALSWFGASHVYAASMVLAGALLTIFGPNWLIRGVLARKLAARKPYDWPAPNFEAKSGIFTGGADEYDIAVIGAGIGGLAAAALLAAKGLKVKVFEQHVLPGGFCHSWLRKAWHGGAPRLFRFDAGPHDFSGAYPGGTLDRLLARLGCADKVEWLRLDYRFIRANGEVFDPPRDWRAHAEALASFYPADAEGLVQVFETMKALFDAIGRPNEGFAGPPATVAAMLDFAKKHPLFVQWAERPFIDLVTRHVGDEAARAALLAMVGYISGDVSAPSCAEMAPIFGYYFEGGFYPRGGTSRFAGALAQAVVEKGGEIAYKTPVRKILIENGRATGLVLEKGETVRARAIVANSDPRKTFLELVGAEHLPLGFREKIAAAPPDVSGFAVHLGVKGEWEGKPLTFVAGDAPILIARPGLVDRSDAPSGYSAIDILTLLPHGKAQDWFPAIAAADWRDWRRSDDYRRRKEALADALIAQAEKSLPGLRERIVLRCEASPVTYARYSLSSSGAIYGVAPQGRVRGSKSPIPGLFVAGAMNIGPGVEAAALSGVWAAEAVAPGRSPREAGAAPRECPAFG